MNSNYYYKIVICYEIPTDILHDPDENVKAARDVLFQNLSTAVDSERYDTMSLKLVVNQLKDTGNYIVTYDALFRSTEGLPMEEYVAARDIKDKIKEELEQFFDSVDCGYEFINIKPLV